MALALVGTIVTMVYGSYAAASRSVDLYSSRLACSDRTCLVLRLLARQLRCLYLPVGRDGPGVCVLPGRRGRAGDPAGRPPASRRREPQLRHDRRPGPGDGPCCT